MTLGISLRFLHYETSTQERDQPNEALQVFNLPANISAELGVDTRMVQFILRGQPWETLIGEIKSDSRPRL